MHYVHASEKTTQTIFESLGIPALHIASDAHLALWTTTQTTGVIVDMGASATHITAIHDTKTLHVRRYVIGGRDIDELLMRRLDGYDSALPANVDLGVVRKIKERLCYVAYEHSMEFGKWQREVDGEFPLSLNRRCRRCRGRVPARSF
jgi:actin-related protein